MRFTNARCPGKMCASLLRTMATKCLLLPSNWDSLQSWLCVCHVRPVQDRAEGPVPVSHHHLCWGETHPSSGDFGASSPFTALGRGWDVEGPALLLQPLCSATPFHMDCPFSRATVAKFTFRFFKLNEFCFSESIRTLKGEESYVVIIFLLFSCFSSTPLRNW